MDKSRTTTILAAVISVFLVLTIVGQMIVIPENSCRTETARLYELQDTVEFDGVFIRDEHTVERTYNGVLQYEHEDGSRLAINSVMASVYASSADIDTCARIEKLNKRIETLRDAQSLAGADGSQAEAYNKLIGEKHTEIIAALDEGNYKKASELKYEMLSLQSKRDIAKGRAESYESVISGLESEVRELSARISSEPQALISGETGYFVSSADGYEGELSMDGARQVTPEQIKDIVKAPKKDVSGGNVIGKMIDGYKWKLAAVLEDGRASLLSVGDKENIYFGSDGSMLTVTVEYIQKYSDNETVVIFSGDTLNAQLASARTGKFELVISRYSGIRISADAIRINDKGEKGVYILFGNEGYFRRVTEIYSGEDFVIVEHRPNNQDKYIDLYDNVIVEGKFKIHVSEEESSNEQST
ncbi:MAG: hypothetical protein IJZ51_05465 [Ruminiclostridium sp.]|nr:hypothetical protein [Ruminiclostridium sp.]